jgi:hypothetical protein
MQPYARVNLRDDSSGRPWSSTPAPRPCSTEKRLGVQLTIVQGSYRAGNGASASAGTQDGGGVVDLRTWNLPGNCPPQLVVKVLRQVGFATWYRAPAQGFDPHIHAAAIGDRDLAASADRAGRLLLRWP